jgi:hypothetical protein
VHGARAVQKEIIEATTQTNLAIYFVWMPMVPGDEGPDALGIAQQVGDERARHFFDSGRKVGIQLERDHFERFAREMLASLPQDDALRERINERLNRPVEERPLWDAVLLYQAGAAWDGELSHKAPRSIVQKTNIGLAPGKGHGRVSIY